MVFVSNDLFFFFYRAEKTEVLSDDLLQVTAFLSISVSCSLALIHLTLNGGKLVSHWVGKAELLQIHSMQFFFSHQTECSLLNNQQNGLRHIEPFAFALFICETVPSGKKKVLLLWKLCQNDLLEMQERDSVKQRIII